MVLPNGDPLPAPLAEVWRHHRHVEGQPLGQAHLGVVVEPADHLSVITPSYHDTMAPYYLVAVVETAHHNTITHRHNRTWL